jgi:hypothetical protein
VYILPLLALLLHVVSGFAAAAIAAYAATAALQVTKLFSCCHYQQKRLQLFVYVLIMEHSHLGIAVQYCILCSLQCCTNTAYSAQSHCL